MHCWLDVSYWGIGAYLTHEQVLHALVDGLVGPILE